jgi:hypothetical protein
MVPEGKRGAREGARVVPCGPEEPIFHGGANESEFFNHEGH